MTVPTTSAPATRTAPSRGRVDTRTCGDRVTPPGRVLPFRPQVLLEARQRKEVAQVLPVLWHAVRSVGFGIRPAGVTRHAPRLAGTC